MKKLLTLFSALCIAIGAWAEDIQIGEISTSSSKLHYYMPFAPNAEKSLSQQIYLASEINTTSKVINAVSFYFYNGNSYVAELAAGYQRNVKIYLSNTTSSSLSQFTKQTNDNLFFSGILTTATKNDWYKIILDKEFEWDGESNILLTVQDNSGYQSGNKRHSCMSATNRGFYMYGASTSVPNITDKFLSGGTSDNIIPIVVLSFSTTSTVAIPTNLVNNDEALTNNSATISWDAVDGVDSYTIRYKTNEATEYTEIANIANTEYTFSGLTASTKYVVGVKAIKGSNESAYTANINFTTKAEPYTISDLTTASELETVKGNTYCLTINRTLTSSSYNTLSLPVSMSQTQCNATFGTAPNAILELNSATVENDNLVLNFLPKLAIVAGHAYLVKPANDITTWILDNATISTTTEPETTTVATFIPVLTPTTIEASESNLLVGAGNTLFYANVTNEMKGMRAYFKLDPSVAGVPARIGRIGNAATGLSNNKMAKKAEKCLREGRVIIRIDGQSYNLNGQLIK